MGSVEGAGASRGRFRRAFAALAGTGSIALVLAMVLVPAASAAPWGFEQVTPPVKGAGSLAYVDTFRTSPDGNSFLYTTNSEFSSLPGESQPMYMRYIGHRGADKWNNRSLDPPYDRGTGTGGFPYVMGVVGSSYNLRYVIVNTMSALTPDGTQGGSNLYMRDTVTGEDTLIATHPRNGLTLEISGLQGAIAISYVAPDGKSALFGSKLGLTPGAPECADDFFCSGAFYSWTASGGVKAVSVLPASEGGATVGATGLNPGEETTRDALPRTDGLDHTYFGQVVGSSGVRGIFVRNGNVIEPVSYSRVTGDKTALKKASIKATSDGGRYMLFETYSADVLTEDTPAPTGGTEHYLYRYDALNPEDLTYVGVVGGFVGGALQMSRDGQTVVFPSNNALLPGAVAGETNLYIWRDEELQLIAVSDEGRKLSALSENGRYYAFTASSVALLEQFGQTISSPGCPLPWGEGDGPCDEVYVYDADAGSDQLQCASCREDGATQLSISGLPLAGNDGHARMDSHLPQLVANDGTVFFATKDPLVASDENELEDVYAYKDGDVRLLSRALQGFSSHFLDATTDGKTVFIATNDPIVGTDIDRSYDVYMTREGAGYPFNPVVPVPPCDGVEACRGGVPPGAAAASPGSAFFSGRGNVKGDSKARKQKVSVAKAKTAVGSTAWLNVKAPGKGTVKLAGAGIKAVSKPVSKAATYRLKATLTGPAKRALERSGQLKKTVKVTFIPRQGKSSSVTLQVTYKAAANRKGN